MSPGFLLTAVILAAAQAAMHPALPDSAPFAADSQLRSSIAGRSNPRIFARARGSDAAARGGGLLQTESSTKGR